jgi:predicted phosphodiesterase
MVNQGVKRSAGHVPPPISEATAAPSPSGAPVTPAADPAIILPPVDLKDYIPIKSGRKGDPETQVIHLTDHHDGELTPSFNDDVYKQRLDHLFHSALRITELHRNMYPVNDLKIFITGDMVHGENPFQGAKVESINKGAQGQIFELALPKLTSFVLSCKQEFKSVSVHCVPGNHGRYSKEAPATSNWDIILYRALAAALKTHGIEVEVADTFCLITQVQGKKFFLFHGDQCKASMGVPYFSLTKKMMSWYVTYGGFDYGVCGHFHKEDYLRINSRSKLFMGGSMVTDDPFALQVVGTSSIPTQWTWGVHKEKGVTWCYALTVDNAFL